MSLARSSDVGALGPLRVTAVPPAAGLLVPWRLVASGSTELRVTVVVKAAFVIVPEGPMSLADPEDVVTAEVHHANSAARSVRLTAETAPRMAQCDVLLSGHACAPEGHEVRWMPVRLAVFRDRALVDKTLYVYGDDGGNASFDRVPLVYERAFGGLGFRENPLGTGILELSSRPNLVHPERGGEVACFAPISRTWPARRKLIGSAERKAADAQPPEIHEGFDWAYFQAAPADQRVDHLHGDEWVVLEGMSATLPRVRSRLPSARAAARVHGLAGHDSDEPIPLVLDTLRIDADRMAAWLVWRTDFAVPDEEALAALRVVVGVATEALPLAWPGDEDTSALEIADSEVIEIQSQPAPVPLTLASTVDDSDVRPEEALKPVTPFVPGVAAIAAPSVSTLGAKPVRPAKFGDTIAVTDDLPVASTPFVRPLVTAPPPQWSPVPIDTSTLEVPTRPVALAAPTPQPEIVKPAARAEARAKPGAIVLDAPPALALGVVPWGLSPSRDCLAVIVKATCDLSPGEAATLRAEADPLSADVMREDASGRMVCVHPSDLVPFKVRADVLATGSAHAPKGAAKAMEIALALGHEGARIDRKIKVFGDRRWQRAIAGLAPSEPAPFTTMPVTYERAFGGAGYAANPVGAGIVDRFRDAASPPPLPNLEDPRALVRVPAMRPAPACFAPLPVACRSQSADGPRRAPWSRIPEDLDWTTHQAAPPSQRLPFLRGDEPFTIVGMHPKHASLEGSLPGVAPRAFASRPGDRFEEIALRLDTVVIDVTTLSLTLVWRGVLLVESEREPDVSSVHVLMEKVGAEGMTIDAAREKLARKG
jgi:hypothetical protein